MELDFTAIIMKTHIMVSSFLILFFLRVVQVAVRHYRMGKVEAVL